VVNAPVQINNYDLGFSSSVRVPQGGFDAQGNYVAYPAGSSSWSDTTNLNGSYRFSQQWEGGLTLPIRESRTFFPTGSTTSTSINVPQLFGRYHLGTPAHLVLHGGLSLPYRYRYSQTNGNPSASLPEDSGDASTLSGSAVRFGIGGSHSINRFRFAADVSMTAPFAADSNMSDAPPGTPTVPVRKGDQILLSEGLAYTISPQWNVNGGLRQIWQGDTYSNGQDVTGTASRVFSTSLGASYLPDFTWRWTASFDTQYPFYSYAVNQPYAPSVSIGLTYSGNI
jgi:hypothetical protein